MRTNVSPRCAAGDWARTGQLANERKALSAMTSLEKRPSDFFAPSNLPWFQRLAQRPMPRASSRWGNIFAKPDRTDSLRARARTAVCFHRPCILAEDLA